MNAQQLRASILQMAIEGKLVPQDPADKPVEIDSKDIVPEEEQPFSIPENWRWTWLNNVGSWRSGSTPKRGVPAYYENGIIPWLKTGDLTDGIVSTVPEYITEKALSESSMRLNPKGAVLIAMYGATIGKLGVLDIECTTNQACCACIVKQNLIDNWWLFYYLLSQRKNFIALGAGGAQPNISRQKIISYPVPLPPLTEQKRIVTRIEELMPLVETYGEAQEHLEKLDKELPKKMKQSILQTAIQGKLVPQDPADKPVEIDSKDIVPEEEQPFVIPDNWRWVRMRDIGISNIGLTFKPTDVSKDKLGIPVLRSNNIQNGLLVLTDLKRIQSENIPEKVFVQPRDLLICARNGSRKLVGKVAVIPEKLPEPMTFGAFMAIFRSKYNKYLFYFISSPYFRSFLDSVNTTTINQITQKNLLTTLCPLPPVEEQKRIVACIEKIFKEIGDLEQKNQV